MPQINKTVLSNIQKSFEIEKGVYKDNVQNRKAGKVGQKYGGKKEEVKGDITFSKEEEAILDSVAHNLVVEVGRNRNFESSFSEWKKKLGTELRYYDKGLSQKVRSNRSVLKERLEKKGWIMDKEMNLKKKIEGEHPPADLSKKLPAAKELDQAGIKYKLGSSKTEPIETVYLLINQSDADYKRAKDIINRHNLQNKINNVTQDYLDKNNL